MTYLLQLDSPAKDAVKNGYIGKYKEPKLIWFSDLGKEHILKLVLEYKPQSNKG